MIQIPESEKKQKTPGSRGDFRMETPTVTVDSEDAHNDGRKIVQ